MTAPFVIKAVAVAPDPPPPLKLTVGALVYLIPLGRKQRAAHLVLLRDACQRIGCVGAPHRREEQAVQDRDVDPAFENAQQQGDGADRAAECGVDHDGVEAGVAHQVGQEITKIEIRTDDGRKVTFAEQEGHAVFHDGSAKGIADAWAALPDRNVLAAGAALLVKLVGQHVIDGAREHAAQHVERGDARRIVRVARDQRADRVEHSDYLQGKAR